MTIIKLLEHPDIVQLLKQQKEVNRQKEFFAYNLYTLSTYTAHLENFHSDVIASLLDPEGLHGEGNKFLYQFIDYLNGFPKINISKEKYTDTTVRRETGRLDIWIKDETSKQSIIIENKINDATDRDEQLKDYHGYAIRNRYAVNAIIYLSKDGRKLAPDNGPEVGHLITNITAFDNTSSDLYSGWLKPCLVQSQNEDSRSLIHQYAKLLAHIGNNNMDNEVKELFYQFISKNNLIETVNQVKELVLSLPDYRAERFGKNTLVYSPFKKRWPRYNNYWIFEKYEDEKGTYKLDVWFEHNSNAFIVMWNEMKPDPAGYETVKEILTRVNLAHRFNAPSRFNGMTAAFAISKEYPSLEAVDNAVLTLVKDVFQKLSSLSKQPE